MLATGHSFRFEWRVALELSQDLVGINELIKGDDFHSLNQEEFKLPSRLIAKIYLFRTIFRGSGWAFANDPDFSHVSSDPKYWDSVNEKFYKKYYGLDAQHQRWSDLVLAGKPLVSPFGREWIIPMGRDWKGNIKLPITTLTNYPVQGTAADIMSLARVSLFYRLQKLQLPVKLIQTVHDDIKIDAPSEHVDQVAGLYLSVFKDLQLNIKRMFGYEWKTPLTCEVKVGTNMANLKKYETTK